MLMSMGQSPWDDIKILGTFSVSVCLYVSMCGRYQKFGLSHAHQNACMPQAAYVTPPTGVRWGQAGHCTLYAVAPASQGAAGRDRERASVSSSSKFK